MTKFFVLRYVEDTPLQMRKHAATLGSYPDWDSASAARQENALLMIEEREVEE